VVVANTPAFLTVYDQSLTSVDTVVASDQPIESLSGAVQGSTFAMALSSGDVQVWSNHPPRRLATWRAHAGRALDVALSHDGNALVTGGEDGFVRTWEQLPERTALPSDNPRTLISSVGTTLVHVPAGRFVMGNEDDRKTDNSGYALDVEDERPFHDVAISRDFYIAEHETTVAEFTAFVEATGYQTTAEADGQGGLHYPPGAESFVQRPEYTWRSPGFPQSPDHPVVQVSYSDAMAYCEWLSRQDQCTYRLPTEAEWEYAARAGAVANWMFGTEQSVYLLRLSGNIADITLRREFGSWASSTSWNDGCAFTSPVGSYAANAWGLHDMHGNVWEWCADYYDRIYYNLSSETDPPGPAAGEHRIQRGGSFIYHVAESRGTNRDHGEETQAMSCLGFRIVRVAP
jgi:sulfatase modifying factor 1